MMASSLFVLQTPYYVLPYFEAEDDICFLLPVLKPFPRIFDLPNIGKRKAFSIPNAPVHVLF
uniref:Putative ovule protein n=1 Tax=Solanum chacoense TaxID=4108 RepID=A0A0V0GVN9_SOLCH